MSGKPRREFITRRDEGVLDSAWLRCLRIRAIADSLDEWLEPETRHNRDRDAAASRGRD